MRSIAFAAAAAAVAVIAAAGACQGGKQEGGRVDVGGRAADAAAAAAVVDVAEPAGSGAATGSGAGAAGTASGSAKAAPPDDSDAAAPDPSKQIADLGAIPAWQAVVDRAQLLARRGAKGVVYGRVGPAVALPAAAPAPAPMPAGGAGSAAGAGSAGSAGSAAGAGSAASEVPSPYVWLVDDTEGNGALGIRLALGKLSAKEGDRIAASGAWALDLDRRWYWKAEAIQPLPPPPPPSASSASSASPLPEPPPVPSHAPAAAPLPPGGRPIRGAKDNDIVYFQLSGPSPAREGDGWLVAGQLGEPAAALLILPGERPSYGGQDLRSPDERWQLRRQTNYWVRIGKVRPQGAGKPFLVNARTAPSRVQ